MNKLSHSQRHFLLKQAAGIIPPLRDDIKTDHPATVTEGGRTLLNNDATDMIPKPVDPSQYAVPAPSGSNDHTRFGHDLGQAMKLMTNTQGLDTMYDGKAKGGLNLSNAPGTTSEALKSLQTPQFPRTPPTSFGAATNVIPDNLVEVLRNAQISTAPEGTRFNP